ncbi:MAG: ArnT family glycosyltransferase [Pseudonocardiaceae bacterium]
MTTASMVARAEITAESGGTHRAGVRITLAVITALAGLAYGWGMDRDPLEPYYAAAVQSMSGSWHNFFFGAFDPAGTLTLDKLPGAFWIQALTARLLGVHTWTLVLPQVIEGALTVLVLYRAVRRLAGPGAGLIAALVLAASPAAVALNRGNISDSLMILLVVLAADAVAAAVHDGSQRRLVLAGIWVGLAFQAKMIEAWLLLPALGLTYLVAGPGSGLRRTRQVIVGGVVAGAVSLLWMVVVTLVPANARPYVDGSQANSPFEQVFGYNGFGRFGKQSPLQILSQQGLGPLGSGAAPGWHRLLTGDLGRDIGWLLPLALIIAISGMVVRRAHPRTDPARAGYLLWGLWAITLAAAFSLTSTINTYYAAALAPAIAALCGLGLADTWARRSSASVWVFTAALVAGTTIYAGALLRAAGPAVPGWLTPVLAAVAVVAVVLLLISAARRATPVVLVSSLAAATVAVLLVPAVASALLAARGRGFLDAPFEAASTAAGLDKMFVTLPALVRETVPELEKGRAGAPDLMAVQSAAVASVFSYAAGREVLPIGGFTGTMPSPTLRELQDDIARGEFHLVLMFHSSDPRLVWIAQHCRHLPDSVPPFESYYCIPANAS